MKRKKVYIAGPYSNGDVAVNVKNAIDAADAVTNTGFMWAFVPHLSHFWHMQHPRPYEDWIEMDLAFLEGFDALLRLPGESDGADGEEAYADELGIPIFRSVEALIGYFSVTSTGFTNE